MALILILLTLLVGPVWAAVPNSVVITELTGANQPGRPVTISRVFGVGEIANFAQPMIGGVAPSAWQTDVKTRWPDGSLRHAMISFRTTISAGASITVSFVNNANPCSTGNQGACDATALSQQGMVDFNAGQGVGSWRARIEGVASGISQSAEARAMIAGGKWSYWLRGPVVTQVIVEDRTPALSQDFGWQCTANCTGDYATATWIAAPSTVYQSLHPIFVASFYPGYAGVEVDYILENPWSTRLQDQRYALNLYANNPEVNVLSMAAVPHWGRSRWHKKLWNGATPGRIKVDYNLPYLIESRAVPNFDLTKNVPSSTVSGVLTHWAGTDKGAIMGDYVGAGGLHFTGFWSKYMPNTGGREEIGLFPTWVVRYLYTFHTTATGDNLYDIMLANGDAIGQAPMHAREGDPNPSLKFCALSQACVTAGLNTVPAFGYPRSRDAFPAGASSAPVAPLSNSHNWTVDTAHAGSMAYIPYVITGDWFYLQEMNAWAAFSIQRAPPGSGLWWQGHDDWAYMKDQTRGMAWSMRNVGHAAAMNPDGTPEKAYFTEKLLNNIAVHEGRLDITNGYGHANDLTKWTWGNIQGSGVTNSPITAHIPNPLFFTIYDNLADGSLDTTKVSGNISPWMVHFFVVVLGHLEELGFPTTKFKEALAKPMINELQNPAYNPWLIGEYRMPAVSKLTGVFFTTWDSVFDAYLPSEQTRTTWSGTGTNNADDGYPFVARGAAAFLPGITDGPYSGDGAWLWFSGKLNESLLDYNPKWAFLPRRPVVPPTPTCDLNGDGQVTSADVQISINYALNGTFSAGGDLDGDGRNTVIDTQRTVNASMGAACRLGP